MLAARGRIELGKPTLSWLADAQHKTRIVVEPISPEIAVESCCLPAAFRSDPADEMIVATARVTGATLVTHDRRILDYAAAGHVSAVAA